MLMRLAKDAGGSDTSCGLDEGSKNHHGVKVEEAK